MIPGTKWARRYGAYTRRTCARPGCGIAAAATLRFLPTQREAWLVDLDDTAARTEGDLCSRHAAALVLPRGWHLHDERSRSDAPSDEQPAPHREWTRAGTRRTTLTAVREAEPEVEVEPAADIEDDIEPEVAGAQQPRPDTRVAGEALNDVLDARTPLLKRAFSNVWPLDTDG